MVVWSLFLVLPFPYPLQLARDSGRLSTLGTRILELSLHAGDAFFNFLAYSFQYTRKEFRDRDTEHSFITESDLKWRCRTETLMARNRPFAWIPKQFSKLLLAQA